MRTIYPLILALLAVAVAHSQPQDPPMDEFVITDGDNEATWSAAEATIEPDPTNAREGQSMRLHIDVNHETGQPDYPIGWPRAYVTLPEGQHDWSDWDFVDFWLYSDTSRESLPGSPIGFIVRCPDRNSSFSTTLTEAKKGEWVHFRFPTSVLPTTTNCTAMQFYISESAYNHGDVLDFWIEDLRFLRYSEPTIVSVQPLNRIAYTDSGVLRVAVDLTGLEEGQTERVEVGLNGNGKVLQAACTPLGQGVSTIALPVADVTPGNYEVWARVEGKERTLTDTVRVITSPWEDEQQ